MSPRELAEGIVGIPLREFNEAASLMIGHHSRGGRRADRFASGWRARLCPTATPVLVAPGDHIGVLSGPDPVGEDLVLPQIWPMADP